MKTILISLAFTFMFISLSSTLYAEDNNEFNWLVGHWHGEAFGGTGEEVWQPMSAGTMIGTYKQIMKGKIKFYEFMIIEKTDSAYTMKLKHFTPEMVGWEEKAEYVEFPYLESGENYLKFDGLSFYLKENGTLEIKVRLEQKKGAFKDVINVFKK